MDYTRHFSADYTQARERFLAAAARAEARLESLAIPGSGPKGESLAIDVARLGHADVDTVVVVSSGLHGVEGFFGSAVQLAWFEMLAPVWTPPPGTAVVMVHALNPHGFAWVRRWNENNVDLNRNFLADRDFITRDPAYADSRAAYGRLSAFLNPASPPLPWEPYRLVAARHVLGAGLSARRAARARGDDGPSAWALPRLWKRGVGELQKTLPVGQYDIPHGLFFGGGDTPEATVRLLRDALPGWAGAAREVIHVDFHTGLGARGTYRLLLTDVEGSDRERWASQRFGDKVEPWGGQTSYLARGLMSQDLPRSLPNAAYQCLTAEFGTDPPMTVLGALRAENRAHFHDRPGTSSYRWAKQWLMDAFCPSEPSWRRSVVEQGLDIIDRVVS